MVRKAIFWMKKSETCCYWEAWDNLRGVTRHGNNSSPTRHLEQRGNSYCEVWHRDYFTSQDKSRVTSHNENYCIWWFLSTHIVLCSCKGLAELWLGTWWWSGEVDHNNSNFVGVWWDGEWCRWLGQVKSEKLRVKSQERQVKGDNTRIVSQEWQFKSRVAS